MLIALFIKLKMSFVAMIALSLVMCGFGTVLNGFDAGSPLANIFLGYLIGTEDAAELVHSYFPILNWMPFPVCGYAFGHMLKKVKNKDLFYAVFSIPTLLIAIAYFIYGVRNELGMFGEGQNCYYHMIFPDALASLCMTVGMFGVYYVILKIFPRKMFCIAWRMSENISNIYFIHWVLVSFAVNVVLYSLRGTTILPLVPMLVLGAGLEIAAIVLGINYPKWKGRRRLNAKKT